MNTNDLYETEGTDSTPNTLRRFVREELDPAIANLELAAEDDVDAQEAYATYLLRAAEAGALADSALLSGSDARDRALRHAREATYAAAALVGEHNRERHRSNLTADTRALVDAVEELAPETTLDRPEEYAVDDRDDRWTKFAPASVGMLKLEPYVHVELDTIAADLETRIELHPSSPGEVNIGFSTAGTTDGNELRAGSITKLSPDQAEALAAALLECAEGARRQEGE